MRYRSISRKRSQERGQTIALVALTIVTLLAMAALAIDVVTLYVAKGEVQRVEGQRIEQPRNEPLRRVAGRGKSEITVHVATEVAPRKSGSVIILSGSPTS